MLSAARHTEPGRAGVLLLRVWLEASGALRIRMIGRIDVEADDFDAASAATTEEALAYVRAWLERFAASGGP
jgi:hypothetical protein